MESLSSFQFSASTEGISKRKLGLTPEGGGGDV